MNAVIVVMVIGIPVVVTILILLIFIIKLLKDLGGSKSNNIMNNNTGPLPATHGTSTGSYELIAVITAAIAASLHTSPDRLVVRSLRQVNQNDKPAWRTAAKTDSQKKII